MAAVAEKTLFARRHSYKSEMHGCWSADQTGRLMPDLRSADPLLRMTQCSTEFRMASVGIRCVFEGRAGRPIAGAALQAPRLRKGCKQPNLRNVEPVDMHAIHTVRECSEPCEFR